MSETSEKIDKGEVVVNMEPKSQRGITDEVKQKYSQNFEAHALRSIEDFFDKNKFRSFSLSLSKKSLYISSLCVFLCEHICSFELSFSLFSAPVCRFT